MTSFYWYVNLDRLNMDGLGINPGIKVLVIKDSFKRVVTIPQRTLQSLRTGITKEFNIPNNESVGITRTVFYMHFFFFLLLCLWLHSFQELSHSPRINVVMYPFNHKDIAMRFWVRPYLTFRETISYLITTWLHFFSSRSSFMTRCGKTGFFSVVVMNCQWWTKCGFGSQRALLASTALRRLARCLSTRCWSRCPLVGR